MSLAGDKFLQPHFADSACTGLRREIAFALFGSANVIENVPEDRLVGFAVADQFGRRNANAFLVNRAAQSHRSRIDSPYVSMVCSRRNVEERFLLAGNKDGLHHGDVRQMRSACKWIVEYGNVSRFERQSVHRSPHRHRHGAKMDRHVVAHGDGLPGEIENRAGVVAPFFDVRRKGRAPQDRTHLLGNRAGRALENREFDWIEGGHRIVVCGAGAASTSLRTSQPVKPSFIP